MTEVAGGYFVLKAGMKGTEQMPEGGWSRKMILALPAVHIEDGPPVSAKSRPFVYAFKAETIIQTNFKIEVLAIEHWRREELLKTIEPIEIDTGFFELALYCEAGDQLALRVQVRP